MAHGLSKYPHQTETMRHSVHILAIIPALQVISGANLTLLLKAWQAGAIDNQLTTTTPITGPQIA